MNRIFCVFLLFAISCANWILASQQPCPDLSLYRIIDKHSHANGAIMLCHSPANFSFSITSDELKKLQNTPNKSPATGIYSTQRDNQCVGIIIPTNVIDDLRKVTNYSREKESPSTFNFYLINALSPGTIWNKTDSQKQNSHDKKTIDELDRVFFGNKKTLSSKTASNDENQATNELLNELIKNGKLEKIVREMTREEAAPIINIWRTRCFMTGGVCLMLGIIIGILTHKFYVNG